MKQKKDTVGKVALDLMKATKEPVSVIDQARESLSDYEKSLLECIASGQKTYPKEFYVTVAFKKEPLMENVLRCFFVHRKSCPTPDYDQIVYRYDKAKDMIDFLWVIPSKYACIQLKSNAIEIVSEEKELLKFVMDFADGMLYKKALALNKEDPTKPNLAIIRTSVDS